MKLSIIIPYFETYDLTMKLLMHLLVQLPRYEVEIILIDDGNNEIGFDMYLGKISDKNFNYTDVVKVIHQKNMGVAKTRNKGIKLAKGKYIAFIDCDDMITTDYIDILLNAIKKYDTDIINFNWVDLSENILVRKPKNYAPWKAIYKKETMPTFREDMKYGSEDVIFQDDLEKGDYSITYLDRVLYLYNSNREGSLLWKKKHDKKE